ncbi:cadherin domain-containing protein [Afipia sp. GAS231]|uniref:cadherin domain-containing protein n=1 Tax=Afipia sp. GAS231 TaxID=1882747 RepID=UPI00087CDB39|nr:cadherin domain-containing protein [Afipia sp. GAS231]SDO37433.1 VCBS repeat-containing protein [Afipia sp. GAS231]
MASDLPAFPGFPSPPSPPSPPPGGGTPGLIIALPFLDTPPSQATDSNGAANAVAEGAAVNTLVGITAHSVDAEGQTVTYSLGADSSGGGFKIDPATGVVSVADSGKIDFETAPGHAYTITVNSSDGFISGSQNFTIAVTDVAPTAPVDSNAAANAVTEGAAANTTVGVTAASTDINGPAVTYSLTADTSGGGFKIDPVTGIVTVADATKIDYESAPGHAYTVTAQASDGTLTNSQTFTIAVNDVPLSTPVDTNAAANNVAEGAANGTAAGITAFAFDPNGPATTYSLTGDTSGGGFTINAVTGVVTVADFTKIDYESSGAGHSYTITVQANDGLQTTSHGFTIGVADVAPSTPVDSDAAANSVLEGAANGSTVGVTASSTDVNGPAVTYSLTGDTSGGGFTINAATGVVTVADSTKIDYESAPGHAYTVTAQASDGTLTNSQTFTIAVANVPPSTPVDSNAGANTVAEGAAAGSTVGVTASSTDINGPAVTYSLTGDTSGGGFTINAVTGVVTVADPTKIDYESAPGHAYTVTAQASDGTASSSQIFIIAVTDVAPSTPVDSDAAANSIAEGPANGSTVGVTASSTDVNGPAVTYSLTGDTSGGGFTINATTGVITVADSTKIDYESSGAGHSYTVTATASDGTQSNSQAFVIDVTDVAPSTPVDSNAAANQVSQGAPVGTVVGLTASSTDVNGPAVTYSLIGDTSGGGFTINAATGVVTVADPSKVIFNAGSPSFDVRVDSSDGTLHNQQTFTINVLQNTPPVANDDSLAATEAGGLNNSIAGSNPAGNVILGTGSAGAVQDTDAQDPSNALTVVAVHTGPEGASTGTGTVNSATVGSHGTLTLNSDGSYTYLVNQTDAQVQALHTSAETITDVFNYTIQDTGGLQDTATLTVTIHGADDLPQAVADTGTMTEDDAPTSFNVIANDTQDPDHTASNTITLGPGGVTVTGPGGETFANTDATASIVANQIQITLNNAHFQQLALGEHATITAPYTLTGDAGETSSANLVVTVNGVNDVPVAVDDTGTMTEDQSGHAFTVLANDTLDADHGAPNNVTVNAATAVTNLSAPSGEGITASDISVSVNGSNQVVVNLGANFQHMQDGQSSTFDVAYTLHGDQPGDTSTAELHVTVTGANDAPVAGNFTFNGVNSAIGNTDLVVNDPADTAQTATGPAKTISASLLSGASDVDGPGPLIVVAGTIATAHGGAVTMQSDGDFIYKPPVGYTGSDSFNYQVSDQNAGASGVGLGTGTVTINVASPHVWYVNADAATDGDGSSENPFNSLSHFNGAGGVDGSGDTIVLETASAHYTGGLTLENNEQLISQSAGVTINGTTLLAASGANAVVDGGVILGSGNNIQGVDFGATSGFAVSGSSVGTVHIDDSKSGVINNASGGGISIGGSSNVLNVDLSSVTTGGGTNGIVINGASGSFHAHGGTISGASGSDVSLSSGTLNFTDDGSISDNSGSNVSVSSMTGGTQSFTGAISGNGSTGISLTSNTGSTIDFSGGINLSTGASNAFTATGGGTVNVTGTNHLTTTTGTALNINNTTIGSSNVTFHDISANGAANGIVLNNTGTSGHLAVTGGGSSALGGDNSGGTIQNTTGDGISLTNTSGVTFTNIHVTNTSGDGINGTTVGGFTLANSTVDGANGGSAVNQGSIYFTGLTGTANVTNDVIKGGHQDNVSILTSSGTLDLTVSGSTIRDTDTGTNGNDNLFIEANGTSTVTAHVQNNTFAATNGDHLQTVGDDSATLNIVATGNTLSGGGGVNALGEGITISGGHSSPSPSTEHVNFNISNNTMTGTIQGGAINVNEGAGSGTWQGQINNNTVGNPAITDSGAAQSSAIRAENHSNGGALTVLIDGNNLSQFNGVGISLQDGESSTSTATLNATVTNNVESNPGSTFNGGPNYGLLLNVGVASGSSNVAHANIHDNTLVASTSGGFGIRVRERFGADIFLDNYAGGSTDQTAVANYLVAKNPGNTAVAAMSLGGGATQGGGFFNGTTPTPIVPLQLFAAGGVQASPTTPGEMNLTMSELNVIVAAAIADWTAAGASAAQIDAMHAASFSIANLSDGVLGQETPGAIQVSSNAAGNGWFVDATPAGNSEFPHAANPADTDLLTDPSNAAAGHVDLLTVVMHELGHIIGIDDTTAPADINDLMFMYLADGERRLPTASDVGKADPMSSFQAVDPLAPPPPAPASTTTVAAPAGSQTFDAGHGGQTLVATAGPDTFVFANVDVHAPAPPPVTLIENYSFAQGDKFDFSAITSQFHASGFGDALIVRAVEDAGGKFATLQVDTLDPHGLPGMANWVNVAQLDGAHAGDAVNVLIDGQAVHLAQIHVGLLA